MKRIGGLYARFFAGHPYRVAAAIAALAAGAALAWYLGSPLFIRTTASEQVASEATVLARGELQFVDAFHSGKGPVLIIESGTMRLLRFDGVTIQNGPDLHVYLSKDTGGKYVAANTLYLGPLRATNGSFNYELPPAVRLADYRSVIVWCRAFSVLFTWADFKP